MDQRKFSKINGKGDRGGWVKLAHSGDRGVLHYLQQSFFRIKMALNIRRRYLAMTETVPVEGELVDTVDDIISFSVSSSPILIPNSFSTAMSVSMTSRESRPRSLYREAVGFRLASSTPS